MFSTGEFSRIARVSKRLLQFYDEEGVFRPAVTDPQTGYRRYRARQLAELNRILALKEMGLSLAEIRTCISERISNEAVRAMFEQKRIELERSIQDDLRRLRAIEARLNEQAPMQDVLVKSLPERQYLCRSGHLSSTWDAWEWVRDTGTRILSALPRRAVETISVSIPGDGFEYADAVLEAGAELSPGMEVNLPEMPGFEIRTLPARQVVAAVIQSGGPEVRHHGSSQIGRWMEANGFTMVGVPREAVIGLMLPERLEDAMIESQFEVRAG